MSELKRCPFCGGDCIYKTFEVNDLGDEIPVIFCNWCKVVFKVENDSPYLNSQKTYEYLEEKNIKAWNTRTPMDKVIERLEELRMRAVENDCSIAEAGECYSIYCETCYMDRAIGIVIEEVG